MAEPDALIGQTISHYRISRFQRIDFGDDENFDARFAALTAALDADLVWVQVHTRLQCCSCLRGAPAFIADRVLVIDGGCTVS